MDIHSQVAVAPPSNAKSKSREGGRQANQGQIIKGLTNNHQRKDREEIIVYTTNPYELAMLNKGLNSPGLLGLSSSLYLNESHGTFKQALSSKNRDINHLSDESFGIDGKGK